MKKVKLLNGIEIETFINEQGNEQFPPLQDVLKIKHACDVCPLRKECEDNNEFDCQVYGMFMGFFYDRFDVLRDKNLIVS